MIASSSSRPRHPVAPSRNHKHARAKRHPRECTITRTRTSRARITRHHITRTHHAHASCTITRTHHAHAHAHAHTTPPATFSPLRRAPTLSSATLSVRVSGGAGPRPLDASRVVLRGFSGGAQMVCCPRLQSGTPTCARWLELVSLTGVSDHAGLVALPGRRQPRLERARWRDAARWTAASGGKDNRRLPFPHALWQIHPTERRGVRGKGCPRTCRMRKPGACPV